MTSKRKGWVRLGIVLSLMWVLCVVALAVYELRACYTGEPKIRTWPEPPPGETWYEPADETLEVPFRTQSISPSELTYCEYTTSTTVARYGPFSGSFRWGKLSLLILTPLLVGWVLIPVIVYAVAWVWAGFRAG